MRNPGEALPILLVVLDGLADRPYPELVNLTPLEAARTPVMDNLAAGGQPEFHHPLGSGRVPSPELVHWRFFGYKAYPFCGRACLEALGHGLPASRETFSPFWLCAVSPAARTWPAASWAATGRSSPTRRAIGGQRIPPQRVGVRPRALPAVPRRAPGVRLAREAEVPPAHCGDHEPGPLLGADGGFEPASARPRIGTTPNRTHSPASNAR